MELALGQFTKEEEDLRLLNEQLQNRSVKFGAEFTPLTLTEFKLFKIQKAKETGNIEYLDNILLQEVQDLQERKSKIKQRIQQFYPQLKVQSHQKFFEEKQAPDFSDDNIELRQNAWNLFGVDYMSNQRIRNYFHVNPHFRIEWLNDSSCNVVFNSKEEAEEAIKPHILSQGMQDQAQIWYELQEYEVEGTKRKLYCRLATNRDIKRQETHGHNSQYYKWKIGKQKLGNYVKRQAYRQINKTQGNNRWEKTKGINRTDKYHASRNQVQLKQQQRAKRAKKQEQSDSSSSGLDDSEEKMAD